MKNLYVPILLCCVILLLPAQKKILSKQTGIQKTAALEWKQFDGNRINATINSAGQYADYLKTGKAGLEWPKGSGKSAVFTSGLWIVGKHIPSDSIRTAVQCYQTEFQPGPILSTFNTITNDPSAAGNPYDERYRIYKINVGDNAANNVDYAEWPGDLGAPYIDINKNGQWDAGIDTPQLLGDQTLWSVYNDVDSNKHNSLGTTLPMGIEVQATYFGTNQSGPLGDVMYIKWKIINKSDATYDSVHIGLWTDTDLGDADDDVVGCDTNRSLGYFFNADNDDAYSFGYGYRPPANGYVFIQGPQIASAADSAFVNGKFVKGYRNLTASSHNVFELYSADPPLGSVMFPRKALWALQGLATEGNPIINPVSHQPTTFVWSGDPVTGTGWTYKESGLFGYDWRAMISCGPFTFAPGDTQEVVGAFVIARGTDRLNSITELRATTDLAKKAYLNNFRDLPHIEAATLKQDDTSATVLFTASSAQIQSYSTKIYVYGGDSLYIQKYFLVNDGTNGDAVANDNIYSYTFTVPASLKKYFIDLTHYTETYSVRWDSVVLLHVPAVRMIQPVVYSDNLNNDGIPNPGETVRFGFSLRNPHSEPLSNVTITADVNTPSKQLVITHLPAMDTVSTVYLASAPSSYLSFALPSNFVGDECIIHCTLTDSVGRIWSGQITLPVAQIQQFPPTVTKTKGSAAGTFDVIVTDESKIKDHTYILYGIDSAGYPARNMFGLKDSTTGTILAERLSPSFTFNTSPSLPEFDGFKLIANNISTVAKTSAEYSPFNDDIWFNLTPYVDTAGGSSIFHYASIQDVRLQFSTMTDYEDTNGNKTYDQNEKYFYDSTNVSRSQKAYFYRQENNLGLTMHYIGFLPIPFAVFDISGASPRQLAVVVNDRNRNHQWDLTKTNNPVTLENTVYLFDDAYDPSGSQYDSSKGGTDLSVALRTNKNIPYIYRLGFYRQSPTLSNPTPDKNFLNEAGDLLISSSHPFSSRDEFVFNPTILTDVAERSQLPTSFALEQNFPNPFNPSTTIRFALPERSVVTLTIFNVLGQQVANLVNEPKNAGVYSVQWNGKNTLGTSVASGLYFYQIMTESFAQTKKMLLIK